MSSTSTDGTKHRPAIAGDLSYIFATILRDMRDADGSALEDDLWFPAHRTHVERALADSSVEVHVLVPEDDLNEILAYCIAVPGTELLWIHVRKGPLRGHGLARRLLEMARVQDAPARWMTPLGRQRLRNPWRGRKLRPRPPSKSSGSPLASSASSPAPRSPAARSTW